MMPVEFANPPGTVLALDFDGVLAPHAEDVPSPAMAAWLKEAVGIFGPERVFVLTNRPSYARVAWFLQYLPGVRLVTDVRKKPYPDGLLQIASLAGVPPEAVLLVDDRLLTGALAACLAGSRCHYLRWPLMHLKRRPVREAFFQCLRVGERLLVAVGGGVPFR
jgi:hypothetical protein